MPFVTDTLQKPRPDSLAGLQLPRRERRHPSPVDWRDEVLYFLLVDRFSDGREATRPLLDRSNRAAARPAGPDGSGLALGPLGAVRAQPLAGRHHHRRHLEARLSARPRRRPRSGSARCSSSAAISTPTTATASRISSRSIRASGPATISWSWSTRRTPRAARHPRRDLQPLGLELALPAGHARRRAQGALHGAAITPSAPGAARTARRGRRGMVGPRTGSGRPSCRTATPTRGPAPAASAPAISSIPTPSTSAATSRTCATSRSITRATLPHLAAATNTGSRSPTATVSASTP